MMHSIQKLREISEQCLNGKPLDSDLSEWLGQSLQRFLAQSCRTVDEALGLKFAKGGVPWWREEAIRIRDAALRQLAEQFIDASSATDRARAVFNMTNRYASSTWRFDRERDEMPGDYAGTVNECLWLAFHSGATMPIGIRQLRNILGT